MTLTCLISKSKGLKNELLRLTEEPVITTTNEISNIKWTVALLYLWSNLWVAFTAAMFSLVHFH